MKIKKLRWKNVKAMVGTRHLEMEDGRDGVNLSVSDDSGLGCFICIERPGFDTHHVAVTEAEWIIFHQSEPKKKLQGMPGAK